MIIDFTEFSKRIYESYTERNAHKPSSPKSGIPFKFEGWTVSSEYGGDAAILSDGKNPEDLYLIDLETISQELSTDDYNEYKLYGSYPIGSDEEGFAEYSYEYEDIDPEGVEILAWDTKSDSIGEGFDDYESHDIWITKLDIELAEYLRDALNKQIRSINADRNRLLYKQRMETAKKLSDFITKKKRESGFDDSLGIDLPLS